jgi:hypothetical protein
MYARVFMYAIRLNVCWLFIYYHTVTRELIVIFPEETIGLQIKYVACRSLNSTLTAVCFRFACRSTPDW